jgi:hypothetical protein
MVKWGNQTMMKIPTYFRCEEADKIKRSLKFKFIVIIMFTTVRR